MDGAVPQLSIAVGETRKNRNKLDEIYSLDKDDVLALVLAGMD